MGWGLYKDVPCGLKYTNNLHYQLHRWAAPRLSPILLESCVFLRLKFYHLFQSLHTPFPAQARRLNCQIAIPSISTTVVSHCHQTPKAFYGKDIYNMDWFLWSPEYLHILLKFWESKLNRNSSRILPVLGTEINSIPPYYLEILLKHTRIPSRGSWPELIRKTASAEEVSTTFPPWDNIWIMV